MEFTTTVYIAPLAEAHFEALHAVLDTVAREKRFLAFTEAPPLADSVALCRGLLSGDAAASVALVDGQVAGWCDVLTAHGQACAHVGMLGIGLRTDNLNAKALYERLGFECRGRVAPIALHRRHVP